MTSGADPNWDGDLFRLYNKRLGADSWQDDFVDPSETGRSEAWASSAGTGVEGNGDYSRALFGGPGADLFGSGYSPELAESTNGSSVDSQVGSMPSISQPMSPIS